MRGSKVTYFWSIYFSTANDMVGPFGVEMMRNETVSFVFENVIKCFTLRGPAIVRKSFNTFVFRVLRLRAVYGDMIRRKSAISLFNVFPIFPRPMTIEWGCFERSDQI